MRQQASSPRATHLWSGLWLLGLLAAFEVHGTPTEQAFRVPLMIGLTTTTAVSVPAGDYETLAVIDALSANAFTLTCAGEAPDDSGQVREITASRNIRLQDWQLSHTLRRYFHESDPQQFAGTTPEFSAAMINELRATGKTAVNYQQVEPSLFGTIVKQTYRGVLTRVGAGAQDLPLLVNGQIQSLPALHATGRLSVGVVSDDFDIWVLDDPANPLIVRFTGPALTSSILKIDFPVQASAASSIETSLAEQKHALVYGIYFKFGRADIRPQSETILKEIATALKNHAQWRLNIVGHTDNVGTGAANLELSRSRAAAVKAALIERYGISADRLSSSGYGAAQPQEKNDTPQGRARNRRVELIRL